MPFDHESENEGMPAFRWCTGAQIASCSIPVMYGKKKTHHTPNSQVISTYTSNKLRVSADLSGVQIHHTIIAAADFCQIFDLSPLISHTGLHIAAS